MGKELIRTKAGQKEKAFLVVVEAKQPEKSRLINRPPDDFFPGFRLQNYSKNKRQRIRYRIPENDINNSQFTPAEEGSELKALVVSSRCQVAGIMQVNLQKINSSLYIGKGKAEEVAQAAQDSNAEVVVFNVNLSSSQQRNLEDIIGIKTIDRTQLILDIFAEHAKSNAGKLQVELAQLEYLLPRLKGKGLILSRLGGGIGTRGPGEKKLEVERRRILSRISRLKKDLENIRKHRELLRSKRKRKDFFQVCLVGYTNAGKTTLLNALTGQNLKTEQALFTTLDPASKLLDLKEKVIVSDTVGFIHDLPEKLVESFKATLEELEYADMLIHVIDISRKNYKKRIKVVEKILAELNLCDKTVLNVFNKLDKVTPGVIDRIKKEFKQGLFLSAKSGKGLQEVFHALEEKVSGDYITTRITVAYNRQDIIGFLYKNAQILESAYSEDNKGEFNIIISKHALDRLQKMLVEKSQ